MAPRNHRTNGDAFAPAKDLRHWLVDDSFRLKDVDPSSTPGSPGDRDATEEASAKLRERLGHLQERLRAEENRAVLLVLQALDAGGKDGTIRSVFRGIDPLGVEVHGFGVPTEHELAHDFLWRVHAKVPPKGRIGIFNRSHYEDVLVVRVKDIVPKSVWEPRYELINGFESILAAAGTTTIKVMLHISKDEQRERLQSRVDDPTKRWKFRLGDLEDRKLWNDYMSAYQDAMTRTSTGRAPWFCVPADRKWYRDWAVLTILVSTLEHLDPEFPERPDVEGVLVD